MLYKADTGRAALRQGEAERRAFARPAFNADLSALRFDQSLDDGQAKPCVARLIADVREASEDQRQRLCGYAFAGVADAEADVLDVFARVNHHAAAARRVANRIRQQVVEDARYGAAVGNHPWQIRPDLIFKLDVPAFGSGAKTFYGS